MTHRHFHYDPETGKSTPVQPVELPGGSKVLVPLDAYQQVKREIYGIPNGVAPESADAAINEWEKEED